MNQNEGMKNQKPMQPNEPQAKNEYGQSAQDIQKNKDDEKNIRNGYAETRATNTNPYLNDMYNQSTPGTKNQPEAKKQPQAKNQPEAPNQPGMKNQPDAQKQDVQSKKDEEVGDPMDTSMYY
jgi:hypothetical protein